MSSPAQASSARGWITRNDGTVAKWSFRSLSLDAQISTSSLRPLNSRAFAWSNFRPCADSRTTFRAFPALRPHCPYRLHRFKYRPRLQQHAFAAAKRPVIHRPMPVLRPRPQIVHPNLDQPRFPRLLNHAVLERPPEKLRENRHDVKLHC